MAARQSAAVDKALRLIAKGHTLAEAARRAGVSWSTLWRAQIRAGTRPKPRKPYWPKS